jgi:hypothetical protein
MLLQRMSSKQPPTLTLLCGFRLRCDCGKSGIFPRGRRVTGAEVDRFASLRHPRNLFENRGGTEEKNTAALSAAEQTIELARRAMENYLDFFQRSMFASPWAETDLNKKIQSYAGQNLATTFEFAQKLTKAKDLQELVQIQTKFMQTQMKALSEQAKDIGETATKEATQTIRRRP